METRQNENEMKQTVCGAFVTCAVHEDDVLDTDVLSALERRAERRVALRAVPVPESSDTEHSRPRTQPGLVRTRALVQRRVRDAQRPLAQEGVPALDIGRHVARDAVPPAGEDEVEVVRLVLRRDAELLLSCVPLCGVQRESCAMLAGVRVNVTGGVRLW